MQLTVKFFARLRDELGCDQLQLELVEGTLVSDLRSELQQRDGWDALAAGNVLVAVNQQIANDGTALSGGDEVAFFPPVTGG